MILHAGSPPTSRNVVDSFTQRYGVHLLVRYEEFDTMLDAIAREKKLKKFSRAAKIALIETENPDWRDRTGEIMAWRS